MEEDDEFQSHPSPDSGSPVSPPSNGRITVTVAAAPPVQKPLTLALPIQQGRSSAGNGGGGGGGVGGGREDCWSEAGTKLLIDAWGERYLELSRGNLKQKHWKEVADVVSRQDDYSKVPKTDIQCKNRIDTVKKKYKAEKAKISAGGGPSKWLFYERLDYLIGPTAKIGSSPITPSTGALKVVPVGIPVGTRSAHQFQQQNQQKPKQNLRRRAPVDSDSSHSDPEPSPDSTDSFPPESYERKRPRIKKKDMHSINPPVHNHHHHNPHPVAPLLALPPPPLPPPRVKDSGVKEDTNNRVNSVRELTRAIIKFGEAFEQAETSKLQQLVEMEKQRMKFTKELELQRMQFFMKTQLELTQIKHRRVGNNNNHHLNNNNTNMANNTTNNSESSS